MTLPQSYSTPDTAEARQYNRAKRRVEFADLTISFGFLIALLATGWTNWLRDLAVRLGRDTYVLQLFFYVLLLSLISKALTVGLDFYSFRLEHRFNLSNQKFGSWVRDEAKHWLVSLVLATILAEIVYGAMRISLEYWWVIAWLIFIPLLIFLTEIAPVVLLPL